MIDLLFRGLFTVVVTLAPALRQHPAGDQEKGRANIAGPQSSIALPLFNVQANTRKVSIQPSKVGRPHEDDEQIKEQLSSEQKLDANDHLKDLVLEMLHAE